MRYAYIMPNDVVNGQKVCVSLFVQGCPHHCPGCFNQEQWDYNGGQEYTRETEKEIIKMLAANGVQRNFSILGGEPLCPENRRGVYLTITEVRKFYPDVKVFIWTGYTLEELEAENDIIINDILSQIDVLIDGRFVQEKLDLTLPLRGSSNQRILKKGFDF